LQRSAHAFSSSSTLVRVVHPTRALEVRDARTPFGQRNAQCIASFRLLA
jgi:hypothetical protein